MTRKITLSRYSLIPAQPFIHQVPHGFRRSIANPGHEWSVELEIRAAVLGHETADILGVFVGGGDGGGSGDGVGVPVEGHGGGLCG